jgi:uncharacterized protein involved in outer membrane biogenesis
MSRGAKSFWRWASIVIAVLVIAVGAVVIFFDWNWLRGPIEARLSALSGKQVTIAGPLTGTWSWTPRITANDVRVVDPSYKPAPDVAEVRQVAVVIDLEKLLGGKIDLPEIDIDQPVLDLVRDPQGKANWDIAAEAQGPKSRGGMPIIGTLKIADGKLTYRDLGKKTEIDATIATVTANGGSGQEEVTLEGHGTYRKAPFTIRLRGGSFEAVNRRRIRTPDRRPKGTPL